MQKNKRLYNFLKGALLISLFYLPITIEAQEPLPQEKKEEIILEEWEKKTKDFPGAQEVTLDLNLGQKSLESELDADSSPKEPQEDILVKPNLDLPEEFYQPVTLKGNNVPLSVMLKSLGKILRFNLILGPGVQDKKVSAELENIEIWRALNTLLFPLSYSFKVQEKDLVILAQETRVFKIYLPPVSQKFSDLTSNESFIASNSDTETTDKETNSQEVKVGTKILVESKVEGLSLWDDVKKNVESLLSASGRYSLNKSAGMVVISDLPVHLDRIGTLIEELNQKMSEQIDVDVKVVEVTLTDEYKFGIDGNALADRLETLESISLTSNFAAQNFTSGPFSTFTITGDQTGSGTTASGVKLVIDALQDQGEVEVIPQPRAVILINQIAVIQVGTTKSFLDHSTISTTQTGTVTSISTSQVQEGVTMRLMGNIVDDQVYLSVSPVVTTIDQIRSVTSGTTTLEAPQTTTKSINTLVKVKQGETLAIGGLMTSVKQDVEKGIPLLSSIPILGKLFSFTHKKNNKTELIIFITPNKG